jgi:hypothetical protein
MGALPALKDRLAFLGRFYNKAARPFDDTLRKYTSLQGQYGDGPVDSDWREAQKCLQLLRQCCLSLVAKAIQDYLFYFITREVNASKPDGSKIFALNLQGKSWFKRYEQFLLTRTGFRWENSPVGRHQIEQIILCRNDFLHDHNLDGNQPEQLHSKKYPDSRFADPLERAIHAALATEDGKALMLALGREEPSSSSLSVTREELFRAINDVEEYCTFVETQMHGLALKP